MSTNVCAQPTELPFDGLRRACTARETKTSDKHVQSERSWWQWGAAAVVVYRAVRQWAR